MIENTEYISKSLKDTEDFAQKLAKEADSKDVFAFFAPMGAGKTTFSKAFAKGLGITETINSPTFTILNIYEGGKFPLYHFDAYRIEEPDEMEEIGFEEYIYGEGICLIEWAEIIKDILPLHYFLVKIEVLSENERRIIVERI